MENFKSFVKEILPMFDEIVEALQGNNISGCVTFTVDSDGYFISSYGSYENGFEAVRTKEGEHVKMVARTTEVL